jgi:peptidoglycan/LPS O-acetylase OafA/YrhL
MEVFLSGYTNSDIAYPEVFSLLWSPRAHFWFLYALFVIFCVAAIIFSVLSKKIAIVVLVLSAVAYVYPSILPDSLVFRFISKNFIYFAFGIVLSIYVRVDRLSNRLSVCLLACGFLTCQFLFHHTFGLNYTDKGVASLFLAIVSIIFIVSLSSWAFSKPNKLFILIGTSSMEIYLMHVIFGSGVRVVLRTFMGIDSFVFHLAAGCVVGVFVPILTLMIINKLKIQHIFSAPISNAVAFLYNKVFQRTR